MDFLRHAEAVAIDRIRGCDRLVVALSGGVDSGVLLALAIEALGPDRVLAVTGRSASVPESDLLDAGRVADYLGARHELVETRELESEEYRANQGDRCLHCRAELFAILRRLADDRGYRAVAYGAIKDDVGDFRPGMLAADRFGVIAPLLEAGIGKDEVRRLASRVGLPVRDKPAAACLSSRIPVGTPVTLERLRQIERCEAGLRSLGFAQLRVRHHGEIARIELDAPGLSSLADADLRRAVVEVARGTGFRFVTVDLDGYRQGSLNPLEGDQRTGPQRRGGQ